MKNNYLRPLYAQLRHVSVVLLSILFSETHAQEFSLWPDNPDNESKVYVYLPDTSTSNGMAVLMCPGGRYGYLELNAEGHSWAPFFNSLGIATIVLKYELPAGRNDVPLNDAIQAIRFIRSHALDWHIQPQNVGVAGFSASGHLASTLATHAPTDARPNFQILFYPVITMDTTFTHIPSRENLLGLHPSDDLVHFFSNELQVDSLTPPAFIALSADDTKVVAQNGISYWQALYNHRIPATLHVYPTGKHGWGYKRYFEYRQVLMEELKKWIKYLN